MPLLLRKHWHGGSSGTFWPNSEVSQNPLWLHNQIQNCIVCLKTLLLLLFGAALHAKNTVTWFGSESLAHGKLDVLTSKHSNHFNPNTTLDPQLILKVLLERFLRKKSSTKWYTRCGPSWFNPRKLRGRDFKT